MMKKFILFCVLIMFCFLSYGQLNKTVKELRADSITERVSGSGVKIKNANIDLNTSTVNDSTLLLYTQTHGGGVSSATIHDSLVGFGSLKSKNSLLEIAEPTSTTASQLHVHASNYPDALEIYDDFLTGIAYRLSWNGLTIYNDVNGIFSFITETDASILDIGQSYVSIGSSTIAFIPPVISCSLTDGTPTASELSTCGVITSSSTHSLTIVHDSDGTQLDYLVTYDGSTYRYISLTNAL